MDKYIHLDWNGGIVFNPTGLTQEEVMVIIQECNDANINGRPSLIKVTRETDKTMISTVDRELSVNNMLNYYI